MKNDESGNGQDERKSAQLDLDVIGREDGIIPTALLSMSRENSGVLHSAMKSIVKNEDYRQELKTGFFTSTKKQMQMVLAIDEMRECGIDETLVIDLLIAQKAGTEGGLLHDIFQALTHTTFNTNYTGKTGNRFWNRGEPRNGQNQNSPLS